MGLLKKHGKVEWVDVKSIHRLTTAEATAFLLFARAEQERHYRDIDEIEDTILLVKKHLSKQKKIGGE